MVDDFLDRNQESFWAADGGRGPVDMQGNSKYTEYGQDNCKYQKPNETPLPQSEPAREPEMQ